MTQEKGPLFPVPLPDLTTCKPSRQTQRLPYKKRTDQSSDDLAVTNTLVPASIAKSPGSYSNDTSPLVCVAPTLATHLAAIIIQHLCPFALGHLLGWGHLSSWRDARPDSTPRARARTGGAGIGLRRRPTHRRRSKVVLRGDERRGYNHPRRRRFLERRKHARLSTEYVG